MSTGAATYQRFRAHLFLKNISLTKFASSLGTSPQVFKSVVCRFAGGDKLPYSETSQAILEAVEAELRNSPVPPIDDSLC